MKMIHTDSCAFRNLNIETLEHLLLECPCAQAIWLDVESFLSKFCNRNILRINVDKMLGKINENTLVNHVILLVKKHMYYCRCKTLLPNYEECIFYIATVRKTEKRAYQMNTRVETYTSKWSLIEA